MLGVPLGILFVLIRRLPHEDYKKSFRSALKWGFWLSIFLVAVRVGTRNAVSRELLEGFATFITLLAEAVILSKLLRPNENFSKPLKISIAAAVMTLFLYHGFELWLIPTGSVVAALGDYFTVEFLTKILGFVSGAGFAFVSSFMIYKAADALNQSRLKFVFAVIFAAILVLPITLFSQPKPERLPSYNPAQYRKILAQAIHKRRWGAGVVIALLLMTTTSSAGSYVANKQAEIVPAVPVTAEAGSVDVDLEVIKDGHLHRFVYRASSGEMVRYIVILKGGSAYGVGLDACEICGATGYYERDNQVICKLCDVQMNKATIGTRGGCNPIPIEYTIADGKLKVPQAELEKSAKIFQ